MSDEPAQPVIRWGVVGTSAIAGAMVIALQSLPGTTVTAVASRRIGSAQAFASHHGIRSACGSVAELVGSPDIDIVYVASPNHLHLEHALAALDAGKAVVCEKPLALTAAEARMIVDRARRVGLFCMEAIWSRFVPGMVALREMLASGAIGEVRTMTASIGHRFVADPGGRLWDPTQGGGALLDLGPYLVSMAIDLLGPVDDAMGLASVGETGVDDRVGFVLRHRSAALSSHSISICSPTSNDALIAGSEGSIRVHEPIVRPDRLTLHRSGPVAVGAAGADRSLLGRARQQPWIRATVRYAAPARQRFSGSRRVISAPYRLNGYQYQAAEVNRCIRSGLVESPNMALADSIAILEVLDRLRENRPPTSSPTQSEHADGA